MKIFAISVLFPESGWSKKLFAIELIQSDRKSKGPGQNTRG
jgi:hypothetical protein